MIPTYAYAPAGPVTVQLVDGKMECEEGAEPVDACYDSANRLLRINSQLSEEMRENRLWHELTHAVIWDLDVEVDDEEQVAEMVATWMMGRKHYAPCIEVDFH